MKNRAFAGHSGFYFSCVYIVCDRHRKTAGKSSTLPKQHGEFRAGGTRVNHGNGMRFKTEIEKTIFKQRSLKRLLRCKIHVTPDKRSRTFLEWRVDVSESRHVLYSGPIIEIPLAYCRQ